MNNLLIIGAGGHGKVVADIAKTTNMFHEIAFLDDNKNIKELNGLKVIDQLSNLGHYKKRYKYAFIAIGNNYKRLELLNKLLIEGFEIPTLIHPFTYVAKDTIIGLVSVIMPGAIINTSSVIGMGCIVNTNASIDHDCKIGIGVHLSPGVKLGGAVEVGERTWICLNSAVSNNIKIGANVIVAAGSVVLKDVDSNVLVAGIPAKQKKIL